MIFQKLATKRKKKENKPCILKRFLNYGMQIEKKSSANMWINTH